MTDASLNDIYGKVGELIGLQKGLDGKVDELKKNADDAEAKSAAYRQGVREEMQKLTLRTTNIESDLHSLKTKVDAQQTITEEVKTARDRVIFAGTVGKVLWTIGKGLLAAAAGAAAVYYQMTGKPPP